MKHNEWMRRFAYEQEVKAMDIEEVMSEHTKHLLRLAYFYTKNHQSAEDIVQDVFITFYHSNYAEDGKMRAYLSRMTINKCKDYLKSWHYRRMQLHDFFEQKETKKKDALVVNDERATIGEAILSLKLLYREPIILYYYEELTLIEISNVLQLPINTVKTRLKRAKEQLKPMLEDEWEVLLDGSN
jgi:RNA polymerase sigma factor (sigma-70 family)